MRVGTGRNRCSHNLYGAESHVVPILSANNNLQAVGIVNAKTGQTVVKPTRPRRCWSTDNIWAAGWVIPTRRRRLQQPS